ncbi:MAG TPA: hypothetical protein VGI44_05615, partial [Acidimicrobiales bacterium]
IDFSLPLRLLGAEAEPNVGFPFRQLAADENVLFADHFVTLPMIGGPQTFHHVVSNLSPGITEVTLRPAVDCDELRATSDNWPARVADHILLVADRGLGAVIDGSGAIRIGYRPLRDLMRKG